MDEAHTEGTSREVPIACTLSGEARGRRADEVAELIMGRLEQRPLPDGHALRFPGEEVWASRLLAFIVGERACCPFFTFELHFEPEHGPIWLHLRGPAGSEAIVADLLAQATEERAGLR